MECAQHPFQHPGFCGMRGMLCVQMTLLIVTPIFWGLSHQSHQISHGLLPVTSLLTLNITPDSSATPTMMQRHLLMTDQRVDPYSATAAPAWIRNNLWMQYMNYSIQTVTGRSCVICAGYKMSLSIVGLPEDPDCKTQATETDVQHICLVDCLIMRASRQTTWDTSTGRFKQCPATKFRTPSPPLPSVKPVPTARFVCFNRTYGNTSVGVTSLPCTKTHTLYPPSFPGSPHSSQLTLEFMEDGVYGRRYKRAAFDAGLNAIPDVFWSCGENRRTLPANWTGVCAIVMFAEELIIAPVDENTGHVRQRRAVPLGSFDDRVYIDNSGVPRGVPDEFKGRIQTLFGFESLFCWWCSVTKNVHWINYIYYNQQRFIHFTHNAIDGMSEQLAATTLMTWQNRMGVDMLLAMEGGVCVMFGDLCCTFIPNNTAPDGSVTRALEGLRSLRNELDENSGVNTSLRGWFNSIFGKWKHSLMFLFTGIIVAIILLALCGCCIIPCARGLMIRVIGKSMSTQMSPTDANFSVPLPLLSDMEDFTGVALMFYPDDYTTV